MFSRYTSHHNHWPNYHWDIYDDRGFTVRITQADCNTLYDGIIIVYERRNEAPVPNLIRALISGVTERGLTRRIQCMRLFSVLYHQYKEEIERYLMLL